MKYKKIEYKNKKLIRINARKAHNILNHPETFNGVTLYMLPINANPESPFINGFFELTIDYSFNMNAIDNELYVSKIVFYNCNNELGNYLKFYIEENSAGGSRWMKQLKK